MNPQRFLVAAGFGSRRQCDKIIASGRVLVNGKPLGFGISINEGDEVRVDGRLVSTQNAMQRQHNYIALNKPDGLISDRGEADGASALDLPGLPRGLYAIGRLDKDSTGLLLLTDDGDLTYRLTHPSFEHEKEYQVEVEGDPSLATLNLWRNGVMLDGEPLITAPCRVERMSHAPKPTALKYATTTWLRIIMHEGRKRQIKRVAKILGCPVLQLERVRIGPLQLGRLALGQWRNLSPSEIETLKSYADLKGKK